MCHLLDSTPPLELETDVGDSLGKAEGWPASLLELELVVGRHQKHCHKEPIRLRIGGQTINTRSTRVCNIHETCTMTSARQR